MRCAFDFGSAESRKMNRAPLEGPGVLSVLRDIFELCAETQSFSVARRERLV
jgi:hypothetical protein